MKTTLITSFKTGLFASTLLLLPSLAQLGEKTPTVISSESPSIASDTPKIQTSTTNTTGTISEFGPQGVVLKAKGDGNLLRYWSSKTIAIVDESGAPVPLDVVRAGIPATVYYSMDGNYMMADRVVVRPYGMPVNGAAAQNPNSTSGNVAATNGTQNSGTNRNAGSNGTYIDPATAATLPIVPAGTVSNNGTTAQNQTGTAQNGTATNNATGTAPGNTNPTGTNSAASGTNPNQPVQPVPNPPNPNQPNPNPNQPVPNPNAPAPTPTPQPPALQPVNGGAAGGNVTPNRTGAGTTKPQGNTSGGAKTGTGGSGTGTSGGASSGGGGAGAPAAN